MPSLVVAPQQRDDDDVGVEETAGGPGGGDGEEAPAAAAAGEEAAAGSGGGGGGGALARAVSAGNNGGSGEGEGGAVVSVAIKIEDDAGGTAGAAVSPEGMQQPPPQQQPVLASLPPPHQQGRPEAEEEEEAGTAARGGGGAATAAAAVADVVVKSEDGEDASAPQPSPEGAAVRGNGTDADADAEAEPQPSPEGDPAAGRGNDGDDDAVATAAETQQPEGAAAAIRGNDSGENGDNNDDDGEDSKDSKKDPASRRSEEKGQQWTAGKQRQRLLPGRSCKGRDGPSVWTGRDELAFDEALRRYGSNFDEIARAVGGDRSASDCQSHFYAKYGKGFNGCFEGGGIGDERSALRPRLKRAATDRKYSEAAARAQQQQKPPAKKKKKKRTTSPPPPHGDGATIRKEWTTNEEERLFKAVTAATSPVNWSEIAGSHFPNCHPNSCYWAYIRVKKRRKKMMMGVSMGGCDEDEGAEHEEEEGSETDWERPKCEPQKKHNRKEAARLPPPHGARGKYKYWRDDDISRLVKAVEEAKAGGVGGSHVRPGCVDWNFIVKTHFPNCTANACQHQYYTKGGHNNKSDHHDDDSRAPDDGDCKVTGSAGFSATPSGDGQRRWTEEDVATLYQAINRYGTNSWSKVCRCLPNFTPEDCKTHYYRMLPKRGKPVPPPSQSSLPAAAAAAPTMCGTVASPAFRRVQVAAITPATESHKHESANHENRDDVACLPVAGKNKCSAAAQTPELAVQQQAVVTSSVQQQPQGCSACIPFNFTYGSSTDVSVISESLEEAFSKVYRKAMSYHLIPLSELEEVVSGKKMLSFTFPNVTLTSEYIKNENYRVINVVRLLNLNMQGMVPAVPVEVRIVERFQGSDGPGKPFDFHSI